MSDESTPQAPLAAVPLTTLGPGDRGVVAWLESAEGVGQRLLDLGFVPGTPLRVIRRAPLGDPVAYELRGTRICLRAREAATIQVRSAATEPGT